MCMTFPEDFKCTCRAKQRPTFCYLKRIIRLCGEFVEFVTQATKLVEVVGTKSVK